MSPDTRYYLRRLRLDFARAMRGETAWRVCCHGFVSAGGRPLNIVRTYANVVHALSLADAVRGISEHLPDHPVWLIERADLSVCIKLLIAYPCRAARWVFANAQMRDIERQAIKAVVMLQTRQVVLRKVNGGEYIELPIPADAAPDAAVPFDAADTSVGRWEPVTMDEHGTTLQETASDVNSQATTSIPQPA